MHSAFTSKPSSIAIVSILTADFQHWLSAQDELLERWVQTTQFTAESGCVCLVPDTEGGIQFALLGLKSVDDFWAFGALATKLPKGIYHLEKSKALKTQDQQERAYLAFALGHYQFLNYKTAEPRVAQLHLPKTIHADKLNATIASIYLARDMINTPAEDMGPADIEKCVKKVAKTFEAKVSVITGDELLKKNYPTIHTVGRASPREPRVIDLRWSHKKPLKKITLVGKGVCFDSGGLDIKTAAGMLLMKKDMAGSAMMLALAQFIMLHNLPVQLRLLIGAADNVISGNAYKPGDIIKTRSGKTVEITNTDAEGRLVLCDLLTEACTEKPDLLINFATLTGAARIALGEDIPAFFTNHSPLAKKLMSASEKVNDPIWQMPLVQHHREKLKSEIADLLNCADSPYGGSITAALFLQSFVDEDVHWAHFDTCAWHGRAKPSRPVGADVFAIRAVFEVIRQSV